MLDVERLLLLAEIDRLEAEVKRIQAELVLALSVATALRDRDRAAGRPAETTGEVRP